MMPSSWSWMLPLPVLIPLLSAGIALVVARRPRLQQLISVVALSVSLLVSVLILIGADQGTLVLDVGSWAAPIGITLVGDRLAAIMLVVSQAVTLAVMLYSIGQDVADETPTAPLAIYHPTFLILVAGVSNAFLTGDLFNLYVGFEILLAASFVLITLGGTRGRVRAGTVYVVVSLISSTIFLAAIALIYGALGTVNMAQLGVRMGEIDPNLALLLQLMLLVAFGIKAAIFPLSAWLPDSYPTAPAPVTAVFAGLLTKVGIYAILRLQFVLFPGSHLSTLFGTLAVLTMVTGILGAVAQDDIKRLLSFTLVSHIGYMLWGIALASVISVSSAIYYASHHIVVQVTLFLIVGLIERRAASTSASRLSNLARTAPFLAILYFISALNLVGIPPLTGFLGKIGLAEASALAGTTEAWVLLGAGLVTSFLTLYVVIKVWNRAFWQTPEDQTRLADGYARSRRSAVVTKREERQLARAQEIDRRQTQSHRLAEAARTENERGGGQANALMYGTVVALTVVQIGMAVFSGPIFDYTTASARSMLSNGTYFQAVLGDAGRGMGASNDVTYSVRPPWETPPTWGPLLPDTTPDLPDVGGEE